MNTGSKGIWHLIVQPRFEQKGQQITYWNQKGRKTSKMICFVLAVCFTVVHWMAPLPPCFAVSLTILPRGKFYCPRKLSLQQMKKYLHLWSTNLQIISRCSPKAINFSFLWEGEKKKKKAENLWVRKTGTDMFNNNNYPWSILENNSNELR